MGMFTAPHTGQLNVFFVPTALTCGSAEVDSIDHFIYPTRAGLLRDTLDSTSRAPRSVLRSLQFSHLAEHFRFHSRIELHLGLGVRCLLRGQLLLFGQLGPDLAAGHNERRADGDRGWQLASEDRLGEIDPGLDARRVVDGVQGIVLHTEGQHRRARFRFHDRFRRGLHDRFRGLGDRLLRHGFHGCAVLVLAHILS